MPSATKTPDRMYNEIPPSLDPLSAAVEMSYTDGDKRKSIVLCKSRDDRNQLPCAISSDNVVHLFADHELISKAKLVLCYSIAGALLDAFERGSNHVWSELPISEEVTGGVVNRSSVRVVFDRPEDAESFYALVDSCIRNGQTSSVSFLAAKLKKAKTAYIVPIAGKK